MESTYLTIVLSPLIASIIAGFFGRRIGRVWTHRITITGVAIAFGLSAVVRTGLLIDGNPVYHGTGYTWIVTE